MSHLTKRGERRRYEQFPAVSEQTGLEVLEFAENTERVRNEGPHEMRVAFLNV